MESHLVQKQPMLTIFNSEEKKGMAKVICDLLSKLTGNASTERFLKRLVTLTVLSDSWQAEDKDDVKSVISGKFSAEHSQVNVELIEEKNRKVYIKENNREVDMRDKGKDADGEDNWEINGEDIPDENVRKRTLRSSNRCANNGNTCSVEMLSNINSKQTCVRNNNLSFKSSLKTINALFTCKACRVNFTTEARFARHMAKRHEFLADDNRANVELIEKNNWEVHIERNHCKVNIEEDNWEDDDEEDNWKIDDDEISSDGTVNKNTSTSSSRCTNGNTLFTCNACHANFTTETRFARHMAKKHVSGTTTASMPCERCGLMCASVSSLNAHVKRMHEAASGDSKKLSCDVCSRQFMNLENLKRHTMHIHTREREWVCSVCGKLFRIPGHYKEHMRTHTGERTFDCKVCGKRFFANSRLTKHLRSHTEYKPYVCVNCGRGYANADILSRHSCKPGRINSVE